MSLSENFIESDHHPCLAWVWCGRRMERNKRTTTKQSELPQCDTVTPKAKPIHLVPGIAHKHYSTTRQEDKRHNQRITTSSIHVDKEAIRGCHSTTGGKPQTRTKRCSTICFYHPQSTCTIATHNNSHHGRIFR